MTNPKENDRSGEAVTLHRIRIWLECREGEWSSGVTSTPEAVLFGSTRGEALAAAQAFALRMLHDLVASEKMRLAESATITFELVERAAPRPA